MLPILNNITKELTTRDNLGITGATVSLQDSLCPVVNTVTPRVFYWPFAVWNYYEYNLNTKPNDREKSDFDKNFLKRNDYFFVLGNLLANNPDQTNLVGKANTSLNIKEDITHYNYDREYFVAPFGGMQYYISGCDTLGFVTSEDNEGNKFKFPLVTEKYGKPLALAFEKAICNTQYYKDYRLIDVAVPKDVIVEFGNALSLDMRNLDECKDLMQKALFEPVNNKKLNNSSLIKSSEYIKYIYESNDHEPSLSELRSILYQDYSVKGFNKEISSELRDVVWGWENVVGRQYFTMAIELIWKCMLAKLNEPQKMREWILHCINTDEWDEINPNGLVNEYMNRFDYTSIEIEEILRQGRGSGCDISRILCRSLQVLFSIALRFSNREEYNQDYIKTGKEISIFSLIKLLDKYKNNTVAELLYYICKNWILERHLSVAFDKMAQKRDAFYFHVNDGICFKRHDTDTDFTGIRLFQLMQIMIDLGMLS